jgi:hypothetical protein
MVNVYKIGAALAGTFHASAIKASRGHRVGLAFQNEELAIDFIGDSGPLGTQDAVTRRKDRKILNSKSLC